MLVQRPLVGLPASILNAILAHLKGFNGASKKIRQQYLLKKIHKVHLFGNPQTVGPITVGSGEYEEERESVAADS